MKPTGFLAAIQAVQPSLMKSSDKESADSECAIGAFRHPVCNFGLCHRGWLWMIFGAFLALKRPCEAAARLLERLFCSWAVISLNMIQRIMKHHGFSISAFYLMYSSLVLSVPLFLHAKFYFPKTRDFCRICIGCRDYYLISLAGLIAFSSTTVSCFFFSCL
jgi:hypothetical protein